MNRAAENDFDIARVVQEDYYFLSQGSSDHRPEYIVCKEFLQNVIRMHTKCQ